jgi:quinol monooxygenase YgiN
MMSHVSVIAKIPAAPGKGNELAKAFEDALHNVLAESGTRYYIVNADTKDPDTLWIYELYENQDGLNAHMGADWFKEFGKKLGGLVGGAPELHILRPVVGKGF